MACGEMRKRVRPYGPGGSGFPCAMKDEETMKVQFQALGWGDEMIAKLFCLMGFHSIYKVASMFEADCYFACRLCGWQREVYRR